MIDDSPMPPAPPYGAGRFEFAAPGDRQWPSWRLQFADTDCRDQYFDGPDATAEAWAAWDRFAPSYNCRLYCTARFADHPDAEMQHHDALAAVAAFAQHKPGCAALKRRVGGGGAHPCDCGLDNALAALAKFEGSPE